MDRVLQIALLVLVSPIAVVLAAFIFVAVLTVLISPRTVGDIFADLRAIRERDPAAEGWLACMFYPGWWALLIHRLVSHPLYCVKLRTPARLSNFLARFLTASDIHPGATFGRGIFIDHAHGVVIGETAIIGDNVTILHQVTLGGTGKETGKRHPTIEEGVLLSAGSKVLGNIVIGKNSKIGAGSVVVHAVPPDSTVVGIPGKVVASGGQRIPSQNLEQTSLPDPQYEKFMEMRNELRKMKDELDEIKNLRKPGSVRKVQAVSDVLLEIVENKRIEVAATREALPMDELRARQTRRISSRSFYAALKRPGLSLIAEIKKASPSGGVLRTDFDPASIARIYEQKHAAALSVLTDKKYFQGALENLGQARDAVKLPLLRKDFIVDEYQIVEAERYGADAILLIVACLDQQQLHDYREAAEGEGLDALVEVHDEAEMDRALKSGARILGINNRNLRTLETNLETTFKLASRLSKKERDCILLVSESGINKQQDIQRLTEAGIDAVLIGEAFMRAPNIGQKVDEIMGTHDYAI